jgi:hypothetical protein
MDDSADSLLARGLVPLRSNPTLEDALTLEDTKMSAMNIDRVLEVLERELATFEETQAQERPEETSADQATLEKYTELWRRLRSDMEKVADFMNRRGYSVTVGNSDDQGFGVSSGPMMLFLGVGNDIIAGLDFHFSVSDKTIISTYYGRGGKEFGKTESVFLASLDYERDIVPTLANFIPFALGMGEIVWRGDAPLQ